MAFVTVPGALSASRGSQLWGNCTCSRDAYHFRRRDAPQRSRSPLRMADESSPPPPDSGGSKPAPSGGNITQVLEVTFRAVWIKLMTVGVGEGYESALKQFVAGVMAAYKAGYSLMALKLELSANELGKVKVAVDDKGMVQGDPTKVPEGGKTVEIDVGLQAQEKETRLIWIRLIYLTLERFRYVRESAPMPLETASRGTEDEEIVRGLAALVGSTVDAWKRGYNLQTVKLENSLNAPPKGGKELTPAEKSIRSQWMRIVFLTIDMIPDQYKKR